MHTISVPLGDAVHTKRSLCAICGMHRKTATFALTHGIVVRLCVVHRSIEYLRRRSGRAFADQLRQSWQAHGALTSRRRAALATHPRRVLSALRGEGLPGSYAWRGLRLEAEARFGAGDDPAKVIDDLRRRECDGPARCPSLPIDAPLVHGGPLDGARAGHGTEAEPGRGWCARWAADQARATTARWRGAGVPTAQARVSRSRGYLAAISPLAKRTSNTRPNTTR